MSARKPKTLSKFAVLPENEAKVARLFESAGFKPVELQRKDGVVRFCFDIPHDDPRSEALAKVLPLELYAFRAYAGVDPFDLLNQLK